MVSKKKLILKLLLKRGFSSTTKIAINIKANQIITLRYLEELEKEGLVKKTTVPNAVYWESKM